MLSLFGKYPCEIIMGAAIIGTIYSQFYSLSEHSIVKKYRAEKRSLTKSELLKKEIFATFSFNYGDSTMLHRLAADAYSSLHPNTYIIPQIVRLIVHNDEMNSYSLISLVILSDKTTNCKKDFIKVLLLNDFKSTDGDQMLATAFTEDKVKEKFPIIILLYFLDIVNDVKLIIINNLLLLYQKEYQLW